MFLQNPSRLKQGLVGALTVILTTIAFPCYAADNQIKGYQNRLDKGIILTEDVLNNFNFSFVRLGHNKESPEFDLLLEVTNLSSEKTIDKHSLLHQFYGNSVYQQPSIHALKSKNGNIQVILFFRYGGDGDHLENRLHWFEFSKNTLSKLGEQNISDPEIITDSESLDHVKGNYVLSLCDVCDGWEVSDQEDIFFIPIAVSMKNHQLNVTNLLGEDEKRNIMERFNKQKELNIQEKSKYKGRGENYRGYAESVSDQFDKIMK